MSNDIDALLAKNTNLQAYIKTDECIGCTKCIQACPVDAIVGAAKQLHVVLTQECIGCELCTQPCPVDCIEMRPLHTMLYIPVKARQRFAAKINRQQQAVKEEQTVKKLAAKKAYIQAAIERARKKNSL